MIKRKIIPEEDINEKTLEEIAMYQSKINFINLEMEKKEIIKDRYKNK